MEWTRLWRKGVHKARVVQYNALYRLWWVWHCGLRRWFDNLYPMNGEETRYGRWFWRGRPWWHTCCNGDAGGWRTSVCSAMEDRWRRMEGQIYYGDE